MALKQIGFKSAAAAAAAAAAALSLSISKLEALDSGAVKVELSFSRTLTFSKTQSMSAMNPPSEFGASLLATGASGDLFELKEIMTMVGNLSEFQRLCNAHGDFSTGRRVLHYAAEMGHLQICKFLIDYIGVYTDIWTYKGDTPMMLAVKEEHVEVVQYLISKGAIVQMLNSKGFTPLHYAVQRDNLEVINLLLELGAPIEAESVDGTPLQCAASRGNVKAVKFLLARGAQPNAVSLFFGSPLICAIKSQSFECMELLLEAKPNMADPNQFYFGLTPLAYAAQDCDTRYITRLLQAGANPDLPSTDLMKPIEHAALARNREGVEILFPVTARIPHYPNWSMEGIVSYCLSEEAEKEREESRRHQLEEIEVSCRLAVRTKDYDNGLRCCSEGAYLDPSNPKWLSIRSLLHAHMRRTGLALRDAEESYKLSPLPPKPHYREIQSTAANAPNLFQMYQNIAQQFMLTTENVDIVQSFKHALFEHFSWMYLESNPVEMMIFIKRNP